MIVTTVFALALSAGACSRRVDPSIVQADRSDGRIPTLTAAHVAPGAIRIDGRMDEPAWQHTGSTQGFVSPLNGRPEPRSNVNATARLAWDDANLYVGVLVADNNPTTPFRPEQTDPHLWEQASAVELMLQPGDAGDNRDYYEIQVDTGGAIWDTHFDDYNNPVGRDGTGQMRFGHQEWRSGLRQATQVDRSAGRYVMELAIPWASFSSTTRASSPPRPGDTWRVNLYSFRDGQRDSLAWSPILGQGNFHRATRFGRVTFAQ